MEARAGITTAYRVSPKRRFITVFRVSELNSTPGREIDISQ
jgi:hypothetical protein